MESSNQPKELTLPTEDQANWLVFSMQSVEGIKNYLNQFPQYNNQPDDSGISATLIFSGIPGFNTRTTVYANKTVGMILDNTLIDVQQADLFAANSGGKIKPEILKSQATDPSGRNFLTSSSKNKAGYYRRTPDLDEFFTANLAKYEVLDNTPGNKQSVYHEKGHPDIVAKNIWRKYFKKHKRENKYVRELHADTNIVKFNELIAFQKEDRNPICGLLVLADQDQNTNRELLELLKSNSSFKLYFYDNKAEEHTMRYLDNNQAINYLNACIESKNDFASAFKDAMPYTGLKHTESAVKNRSRPQHNY